MNTVAVPFSIVGQWGTWTVNNVINNPNGNLHQVLDAVTNVLTNVNDYTIRNLRIADGNDVAGTIAMDVIFPCVDQSQWNIPQARQTIADIVGPYGGAIFAGDVRVIAQNAYPRECQNAGGGVGAYAGNTLNQGGGNQGGGNNGVTFAQLQALLSGNPTQQQNKNSNPNSTWSKISNDLGVGAGALAVVGVVALLVIMRR